MSNACATEFVSLNRGYDRVFQQGRMSLGLVVPLEAYPDGPVPSMTRHLERVRLAEELGFSALWLRDVPFNVPSFGDAGQPYDPFVYLGYLAAHTEQIALGVASVVLPLRHPAHVAKAAASVDALSGGRLILGVASGDRPDEYPAMGLPFVDRAQRFREAFETIERLAERRPVFENQFGRLNGQLDLIPKPTAGKLPLLITGSSRQDPEWIATHGDGWMTYPRDPRTQAKLISDWRERTEAAGLPPKPVLEPFYVDLADDPNETPRPIHLGLRLGMNHLETYLRTRQGIGVNHVALNLRFLRADFEDTLKRLADELLPLFPGKETP